MNTRSKFAILICSVWATVVPAPAFIRPTCSDLGCNVMITSVEGNGGGGVTVTGTAEACNHLRVKVSCDGQVFETDVSVDTGNWSTSFPQTNCRCGRTIDVSAVCIDIRDCTADAFSGGLSCPSECPRATASTSIGGCNPDGTRTVTITVTIIGATGPVATQVAFGDGALSVVHNTTSYTETHDYVAGSFTPQVLFVIPERCTANSIPAITISPCPPTECPTLNVPTTTVSLTCNADGTRDVVISGTATSAAVNLYHLKIQRASDSSTVTENDLPGGSASYGPQTVQLPGPGDSGTLTPYTVTILLVGTRSCVDVTTVTVNVPGCGTACPQVATLTATPRDCVSGLRPVDFGLTFDQAGVTNVTWDFGDGGPLQNHPAAVIALSHNYTPSAASFVVHVTVTATGPVGCTTGRIIDVMIEPCGGTPPPPPPPPPPDHSTLCGGLLLVVGALLAVAVATTIFTLGITSCLGLPAGPAWYIVAGLWIAVGVMVAIQTILCALGICPCLSECDWLAWAWMAALAGAIVSLYLKNCCPGWWIFLILALSTTFVAAFIAWIAHCDPSRCQILDLLLVTLVSVIATALAYIALVPPILACAIAWVAATVALLGAILAVAVPLCHASR